MSAYTSPLARISIALGLALSSRAILAQQYTVIDVGVLGRCESTAHGLNNLGQVVGESADASYRTYGFVTGPNGTGIRSLGTLPGFESIQPASTAQAINDAGQVVGNVGNGHGAFISAPNGGALTRLTPPAPGAIYAWNINNAGQVVGQVGVGGHFHAFITANNGGPFTDVGAFPSPFNDNETYGHGVNTAGQVVGGATGYCDKAGVSGYNCGSFATGSNGASLRSLGVLGPEMPYARGNSRSFALGINDKGQIVGYSDTANFGPIHAYISDGTALTDLGTFGGFSSQANAINNAGQVVGQYTLTGGAKRAFTWDSKSGMVDLNTQIDPASGWTLTEAVAINDKGQIAANGTNPAFGYGSCPHAVLLTPKTSPAYLVDGFPILARATFAISAVASSAAQPTPPIAPSDLIDQSRDRPVMGLATEGVAQVLIRIPARFDGEVFEISVDPPDCGLSSACIDNYGRVYDPTYPQLDIFSNTPGGSPIQVSALTATDGKVLATAAYRAPLDFVRTDTNADADKAASRRSVNITIKSRTTNITQNVTITLVRPLAFLIHGLWASKASWEPFSALTQDVSSRFSIAFADYSDNINVLSATPSIYSTQQLSSVSRAALGLQYNAPLVLTQLHKALDSFRDGSNVVQLPVASAQADVIGHSMGGLMARALPVFGPADRYSSLDTYGKGYIHKLVTIGTPHRGSPVAQALLSQNEDNSCLSDLLSSWLPGRLFVLERATVKVSSSQSATFSGAIADLVGSLDGSNVSTAIKALNDSPVQIPTILLSSIAEPGQLIALDGSAAQIYIFTNCVNSAWRSPLAEHMTSTKWPAIVGAQSDAIVPLNSQRAGVRYDLPSAAGAIHSEGTQALGFGPPVQLETASGIPSQSVDALNSPLNIIASPFTCLPNLKKYPCR